MLSKTFIVPPGLVGFVLLVFLHLASGKTSILAQDAVASFSILCKPLTAFERLVDEQAIPDIANDTAFSQPLSFGLESSNDSDKVAKSLEVASLLRIGFYGINVASLVIAFLGMGLLMTNTHFSRPVCAVVSLGFWLAVLWIGMMLWPTGGVGLSLVAIWMRKSWVLFPKSTCTSVTSLPSVLR